MFSVGGLGTRQRLPVDAAGFGCGWGFGCGEAGFGGTSESFAGRGAAADTEGARLVAGLPLELDLVGLDDLVGPAAFEAPAVVARADFAGRCPRSLAPGPRASAGRGRRVRPAADAFDVAVGDFLAGDFVAWGFVTGDFVTGDFVPGDFVVGVFLVGDRFVGGA